MVATDWQHIVASDFPLPAERPLAEATAELTTLLGSPVSDERDGIAYPVLATWIDRGVYDDLLVGLGDGMALGLTRGLGEEAADSVFRRSFSALVLASILARDHEAHLLPERTVLTWGDRILSWLVRERDVRGFVPGKGWAHTMAHGADCLDELAKSRHLGRHALHAVLDTIAERVGVPGPVWVHGEHDRLAVAALSVLHRDLVPVDDVEAWIRGLGEKADPYRGDTPDADPYLEAGNPQAFLRALHVLTVHSPTPPPHRADVVLTLADVLRSTNAPLLAATGK